jgi:hypothetical protein
MSDRVAMQPVPETVNAAAMINPRNDCLALRIIRI